MRKLVTPLLLSFILIFGAFTPLNKKSLGVKIIGEEELKKLVG